jgi:hypothetical protein
MNITRLGGACCKPSTWKIEARLRVCGQLGLLRETISKNQTKNVKGKRNDLQRRKIKIEKSIKC